MRFAPALAFALACTPALADLQLEDRDALHAEIREYLLENPEVIVEAMQVLEERRAAQEAVNDKQLVQDYAALLFEDPNSWAGGNLDGDVTLVEFIDYRCGYCKRAHPEVRELIESDGNIKIIRKEFPILGEQSVLASRFAIAVLQEAGDDAYATVSDALMALRGDITEDVLEDMAQENGLDWAALSEKMESSDVTRVLSDNHTLAQQMRINGTPAFVLEDELLRGYVPLDAMRAIVSSKR